MKSVANFQNAEEAEKQVIGEQKGVCDCKSMFKNIWATLPEFRFSASPVDKFTLIVGKN